MIDEAAHIVSAVEIVGSARAWKLKKEIAEREKNAKMEREMASRRGGR